VARLIALFKIDKIDRPQVILIEGVLY